VSYVLSREAHILAIKPTLLEEFLRDGHYQNHPRDGGFRGYFVDMGEIDTLHELAGLKVIQTHIVDPAIGALDELFNRMPSEVKAAWMNFLVKISGEQQFFGSGRTLLTVACRRNSQ
jgi:hypothetical protein